MPIGKVCPGTTVLLAISVFVLGGCGGEPVEFADANLDAAVREEIDLPKGKIGEKDLLKVTRLIADNKNIRRLDGLEFCTNLEDLTLHSNNITDIGPLAELAALKQLGLLWNDINDIGPLAGLTKLELVGLGANEITDIAPLVKLPNLKEVYLFENPLAQSAYDEHIPALEARGVEVAIE